MGRRSDLVLSLPAAALAITKTSISERRDTVKAVVNDWTWYPSASSRRANGAKRPAAVCQFLWVAPAAGGDGALRNGIPGGPRVPTLTAPQARRYFLAHEATLRLHPTWLSWVAAYQETLYEIPHF